MFVDYRELSEFHQKRVVNEIKENVEPGHNINEYNGFEWDEPEFTINRVKSGNACAECYMIWYNCLCSHD